MRRAAIVISTALIVAPALFASPAGAQDRYGPLLSWPGKQPAPQQEEPTPPPPLPPDPAPGSQTVSSTATENTPANRVRAIALDTPSPDGSDN